MTNTERLEALQADLATKVTALRNSEEFTRWLDTASRFHNYSWHNQLLILVQCPQATQVAGFRKWQEFGRQVRKGEKSIGIFAPIVRKSTDKASGEEKSGVVGFRIASVFDVSQTDGDDLAQQPMPVLLDGDAPEGLWDALTGIATENRYTVERGDCNGANGYTQPHTRTIRVRSDVSDAQACKTLAHELGHMFLHTDETGDTLAVEHRGVAEVEAESVAYIVSTVHGLPTDAYSLPYVAAWGGEDAADKITQTGQRVVKTAKRILAAAPVRELTPA